MRMLAGTPEEGMLIFVPATPRRFSSWNEFKSMLAEHGITTIENRKWYAVVFPEQSGNRRSRRYSWLLIFSQPPARLQPIRTFVYRESENDARIPGLSWLTKKKIAIVGCGAIGSKVAVALAAAGVRRFVLVDPDIMEPFNAVRHEAGIDCFGIVKVRSVARRIVQANPGADGNLDLAVIRLGGIHSHAEESGILDRIGGCDLVLNATGHAGVSRYLNEICYDLKISTVYASVTNGAWSGELIRVVPGKTPCWLCFHDQYYSAPPPGQPVPQAGVFGPGSDEPTFSGTGHDVGIVANLACDVIIDTLRVAGGEMSEFPSDYLLWNGRDVIGRPVFQSQFLPISHRAHCSLCSAP